MHAKRTNEQTINKNPRYVVGAIINRPPAMINLSIYGFEAIPCAHIPYIVHGLLTLAFGVNICASKSKFKVKCVVSYIFSADVALHITDENSAYHAYMVCAVFKLSKPLTPPNSQS